MAKGSGLGDNLFYNGYNLSNDIKAVTRVGQPSGLLTRTGIDKSGIERAYGKRDGEISMDAYFNDAAGQAHPILRAAASDIMVSYFHGPQALGNAAASHIAHKVSFGAVRPEDGDLIQPVQTLSNLYPVEWGLMLTAGSDNSTGAESTTGVDFSDAAYPGTTNFGFAAYLQVFAFTGTDATITIQESDDNGSTDAFGTLTGGAFTEITGAPVTERIEGGLTAAVEKDLRLDITTSAGFSSLDYAVMVIRYVGADRNNGASA